MISVGLVSGLFLHRLARGDFRDAHSLLIHALADGTMTTPTLEGLRQSNSGLVQDTEEVSPPTPTHPCPGRPAMRRSDTIG